jgi:hypothetical protein
MSKNSSDNSKTLSNRIFDLLDELTTEIDTALHRLLIQRVSNYF